MKDFKEIEKIVSDIKNTPNSKLVETMDKLTIEFDIIKKELINNTYQLDKIEEFYNKILKEYNLRTNV
jgi:hypothetical protein